MADERPQSVDETTGLVSRIAQDAQERTEKTQSQAQKDQPRFLLSTERSEVVYTMPPRLVPFAFASFDDLRRTLGTKWQLVFDPSRLTLDPLRQQLSLPQVNALSEDEAVQEVMRRTNGPVSFMAGKYSISDHQFVPINSVSINFESVQVSVAGISQIAEAVAAETFEALGASAGQLVRWAEISPSLQRAQYATTTKIDLGVPFETLLGASTIEFLDASFVGGEKLAAHMGGYRALDGHAPPKDAVCTYALDDLILRVTRFAPKTGEAVSASLGFRMMAIGDYGSGIVSVTSELPYEIHIDFLDGLIKRLSA